MKKDSKNQTPKSEKEKQLKKAKAESQKPIKQGKPTGAKAAVRAKPQGLLGDVIHLGGMLLGLCAVVALLLGIVNGITYERIAQIEEEKTQEAMRGFSPTADFEKVTYTGSDAKILEVFEIIEGGQYSGLCVKLNTTGFDGDITMIVGIDLDYTVIGISVISHTETKGLGSEVTNESWASQFMGKSSDLSVIKNGPADENQIVAITGATISSQGVTNGVLKALAFAQSYVR